MRLIFFFISAVSRLECNFDLSSESDDEDEFSQGEFYDLFLLGMEVDLQCECDFCNNFHKNVVTSQNSF